MDNKKLQVVLETPEFIKQAGTCMDQQAKESFINYIAKNPCVGDLIPDTGSARKVRWASNMNQGKSGGARIIYFYYNQDMPIFLFTAYGKNQRANLSMNEKNSLKKIIKLIVQSYRGNNDE